MQSITALDERMGTDNSKASLAERMRAIVDRLQREADDRVNRRNIIEKRWLDDLRQYHGLYDDRIQQDLTAAKKSKLFVNITRPKTLALEARLSDMLFPTDDRNYGIKPTPVPEMAVEASDTQMSLTKSRDRLLEDPENPELQAQVAEWEQKATEMEEVMRQARNRAATMEEEIHDHLVECRYQAQARDVIHDACKLGTGVMKGPVVGDQSRRTWTYDEQAGFHKIEYKKDEQPVYWRVDPWNFFPDPDAVNPQDSDGAFERHLLNGKNLRKKAREPGFDPDAIRRLLRREPMNPLPTYLAEVRAITDGDQTSIGTRYHVWEYHGRLPAEDMRTVAEYLQDDQLLADAGIDGEEVDPLLELEVVVWFCDGELLKFGIHHLDSGKSIYSVFCLEKDDASIFGFGLPYIMRDSQSAVSAAWRIMMDNAGLSSGPQIVIDDDVVEPADPDDDYTLQPRKVWKKKAGSSPSARPFEVFDIPMHQAELANIIMLARENSDDETGITELTQGEQGAQTTRTAQGMSMLMNATNIIFRRIVRNFDDDMTVPNIRRMYDFLMQFSPKDHIKGDYQVDARGSSVLLVREMQSANLMAFLQNFGAGTVYEPFLKGRGVPALRKLVQTMMIPTTELVKSDTEIAEDEAEAAKNAPPVDPEVMKLEMQGNLQERRIEADFELKMLERETRLIELAEKHGLEIEKLRAMLDDHQRERQHKERIFASEAAMEQRLRDEGQESAGSGGYLSA